MNSARTCCAGIAHRFVMLLPYDGLHLHIERSPMRLTSWFGLLAVSLICPLLAVPAQAQRARVFVASFGSDSNPCSFTQPCRTFQVAVGAVLPGGEVTAIDSAGFGAVTINKAVTISSPLGV